MSTFHSASAAVYSAIAMIVWARVMQSSKVLLVRPLGGLQTDRRSRLRLEVLAPLAALRTLHLQVPHDGSFESLAAATGLTSLTTAHPVNHGQEARCHCFNQQPFVTSIKLSVDPEAWLCPHELAEAICVLTRYIDHPGAGCQVLSSCAEHEKGRPPPLPAVNGRCEHMYAHGDSRRMLNRFREAVWVASSASNH